MQSSRSIRGAGSGGGDGMRKGPILQEESTRKRAILREILSRKWFATPLVTVDFFQSCPINLFPPAFPVATAEGAAVKIGKQEPQPIGARDPVAIDEARIQARQVLHPS